MQMMFLPISTAFVLAPPTLGYTMLIQFLNQTVHAMFTWANSSKNSPRTTNDVVKGYSAAICTGVPVALGIRILLSKRTAAATGAKRMFLNGTVGMTGAATAGVCNNVAMR